MRIFQALSAPATGVGQSKIWLRNLYEPLVELGHDVFLWQFEWDNSRDRSDLLLDAFRREHDRKPFNLFFSYFQDGMVEPDVIREIQKTGIPTCNFSCNNTHQFHLVKKLSPIFDFNLYTERNAKAKFDKIGARAIWFPMAANPKYYHPYDIPRNIDVSFIGQEYGKRYLYLWHLLINGIDLHVYGPGWRRSDNISPLRQFIRNTIFTLKILKTTDPEKKAIISTNIAHRDFINFMAVNFKNNIHGPITDEEMIKKYSQSKISLGFLEVYDECNPIGDVKQHIHLREFEAPMCGSLYCTGYCDELTEFYEPEKEIVTYRNEHELLDKNRFYLAHPKKAERIRQAGRRRALECHTYQKRFSDLFKEIGLG